MNPDFWSGKTVFLTGHTGFKGSWLSLWLQQLGASVHGFSLHPSTEPALYEVANVAQGMTSTVADVRNLVALQAAIKKCRPDIVFHLAAQAIVRRSYDDPVDTLSTNIMGTVNVLESARSVDSVRAMVNVTSDKCYENREWQKGYVESDPMGGHDPYSVSKGCSELVTSAYRKSFFAESSVSVASARAGNVIGGGDWATDRLVPDILRAIDAGSRLEIRNPNAVRPWQHVLEPVSGYLLLAEQLYNHGQAFAEAWNFGPNDEDAKPVSWVAEKLTSEWGGIDSWTQDHGQNPHEAQYLKLDISKTLSRLTWAPRWDISTALQSIIVWHRAWLEKQNMREVCVEQISDFSKAVQN
ncbi:MAG: CDP-glucose 4,6-dehydratase [Gammaproteobacteria bacterium]